MLLHRRVSLFLQRVVVTAVDVRILDREALKQRVATQGSRWTALFSANFPLLFPKKLKVVQVTLATAQDIFLHSMVRFRSTTVVQRYCIDKDRIPT